jgi:lysophospholipase L1-like esterase
MVWWIVGLLAVAGVAGLLVGALHSRALPVLGGVVCVIAALGVLTAHVSHSPETRPLDPNPSSSFRIVALGDSYISGEGAEHFYAGTDEFGVNQCHRAATAYPYLAAEALEASLTFVACSGARAENVTSQGQFPNSDSERNGYGAKPQIDVLEEVEDPDVVLISIGGNDAGFAEIGKGCVGPADCLRSASFWIHRLDSVVYPALRDTFVAVREAAPGATVFAMTYPNPIGPANCHDILLSEPEMAFVRDVFVGRLDEVVTFAARAAGVHVIDLAGSLAGHRICEQPLGRAAVNFVNVGITRGTTLHLSLEGLLSLGHGTFHPNRLGHELLAKTVIPELEALRDGRLKPLAPGPPPGASPPPFVPEEIGFPLGPSPFPPGTRCPGREITAVSLISAEPRVSTFSLAGLRPGSIVCYRTYRAAWKAASADSAGTARVPVDVSLPGVGSINEILAQQADGGWKKVVVSRLGQADEDDPPGN